MANRKSRPDTKMMMIIFAAVLLVIGAIIFSAIATIPSRSGSNGGTPLVSSKQSAVVPTKQTASGALTGNPASSSSDQNSGTSVQSEADKLKDYILICASCGGGP